MVGQEALGKERVESEMDQDGPDEVSQQGGTHLKSMWGMSHLKPTSAAGSPREAGRLHPDTQEAMAALVGSCG